MAKRAVDGGSSSSELHGALPLAGCIAVVSRGGSCSYSDKVRHGLQLQSLWRIPDAAVS